MGSWRSFCSRREAVVTLWPDPSKRRPPIGVKLMMSSSAPPASPDRACARIVASTPLDDAGSIVAIKKATSQGKDSTGSIWNQESSFQVLAGLVRRLMRVRQKVFVL